MITVVLPAYEEEAGLARLLPSIAATLEGGSRFRVFVVDDGSRDRTAAVARDAARSLPVTLLRHPENLGLGAALRTGLQAAVEGVGPDGVVVTMDADDSHDPALIPELASQLGRGYDLVIASRFAAGGAEIGVPAHRRALSRVAAIVFSGAFKCDGVRDYTSGYRGYRADLLRRLIEDYGERFIDEDGFGCQLQTLVRARDAGATITEVPLELRYDRKEGESKLPMGPTLAFYARFLVSALLRRGPSNPKHGMAGEAGADATAS